MTVRELKDMLDLVPDDWIVYANEEVDEDGGEAQIIIRPVDHTTGSQFVLGTDRL